MIQLQRLLFFTLIFASVHAQHVRFREPATHQQDATGKTPLHHAIIQENEPEAHQLLRQGASVHARDKSLNTPSDYAEQQGNARLSRLLHEYGALSRWVHLPQ